ncbi:MAG TPA: thioredoxin domain-containing protein [Mycobacteriales bacterium]|nr:thioredoxin domain-containing protein [Mycobacteriales bacterium]
MPNRLADATSPYLLQHADNPVDWWPWCPEAFAEARRRDVPVLLSVGYAACHWCHVMAHESFEDPETGALINGDFVSVKVDREERPDVDAVYMQAVQALTGQGGWPMTVFLTHDAKPFFAGTYFPPARRYGMPAFREVLLAVADAWRQRRHELETAAGSLTRELAAHGRPGSGEASAEASGDASREQPPDAAALDAAAHALATSYDAVNGGFGGAPKFPPSMVLEFLLRHVARTDDPQALAMVEGTTERMARGGIYDQLGGGFARYSVDAHWVVPHFEKMLYDNAHLLRVYTHLWRVTGSPLARRVALETADWLVRELRTPQGGFASALDADSEGEEGRFYVWTPAELRAVLGDDDGDWAAGMFDVTPQGTFEHGRSVLQLRSDPDDAARLAAVRARLGAARERRVRPARDDKVVAAWNGLAIAALAEAGALFARADLLGAAERAAHLLVDTHLVGDAGGTPTGTPTGTRPGELRLRRVSRDGVAASHPGVLEDHGDVAEGFLALYAVTGNPRWLRLAGGLLDAVLAHFADGRGGFYDTADDAEALLRRPQDATDNATPSGAAAVTGALVSYAAVTGSSRHAEAADRALATAAPLVTGYPRFAGWWAAVAEAALAGPVEVAVVGALDDPATRVLHRVALLSPAPGAVVALGDPSTGPVVVPLLLDRGPVDGRPAAYVCRGFTCERPITDPAELARSLQANTDLVALAT